MKVVLSRQAEKQFRHLPKTSQIILARRIRQIKSGKHIQIEKLSGYRDIFRTRVGQYRIVYQKTTAKAFIILVGHKKEVYKLLRNLFK